MSKSYKKTKAQQSESKYVKNFSKSTLNYFEDFFATFIWIYFLMGILAGKGETSATII